MGESAGGKGLGRVCEGLGEDRRVVGDVGGWGGVLVDFGRFFFGGVGKLGWERGLSKAYPKLIQGLSFKPWISP